MRAVAPHSPAAHVASLSASHVSCSALDAGYALAADAPADLVVVDPDAFLDEVSELPPNLQPKLLRALEERLFRRIGGTEEIAANCRILAAANSSFEDALSEGRFREDLFYRLNVLRINVPPLRERDGDPEVLARHFMSEIAREMEVSSDEAARSRCRRAMKAAEKRLPKGQELL